MLRLLNTAVAFILFQNLALAAPWQITKTYWSETDEKNYSAFVAAIGQSGCNTFDRCLKNPANPYRYSDPQGAKFYSDCADLPFMLRAYFASKNGLPFSLVVDINSADGSNADIRYSPNGNVVVARVDILVRSGPIYPDAAKTFSGIADWISSGMLRFHPELRNDTANIGSRTFARLVPDFYSPRIAPGSVRAGTVIYDPNGHAAVVYAIEPDGRVLFMDAHPDNSITHGTYGRKFARSNPGMGAGFKNFRPLELIGATRDASGNYVGGRIYFLPDNQIRDYDTTQYFGTSRRSDTWRGSFVHDGRTVDYYDWVRLKLAAGNLKFHPVEEMKNMINSLCQDIRDRVPSIEAAVNNKIYLSPQPPRLPQNIYGTDGEWESYSTPSRDARLKTSFLELREQTARMVELAKMRDPSIDYPGNNLKADLLKAFDQANNSCVITYKRSDGQAQNLNFEEVRRRLFLLSFDPYHCPERRWGATSSSELASCRDNQTKSAWYAAEQRLRNQMERTYGVRMDFSLEDLQRRVPASGVDYAPDVDTRAFIESMGR